MTTQSWTYTHKSGRFCRNHQNVKRSFLLSVSLYY